MTTMRDSYLPFGKRTWPAVCRLEKLAPCSKGEDVGLIDATDSGKGRVAVMITSQYLFQTYLRGCGGP